MSLNSLTNIIPWWEIVSDYKIALQNTKQHTDIEEKDLKLINQKYNQYKVNNYMITGVSLLESYRIYKRTLDNLMPIREIYYLGRLGFLMITAYVCNFHYLEYRTDHLIRKYGYIKAQKLIEEKY